ncbi:MAG: hypothetical protein P8X82_16230 [Gemmatimonadales bacterium]
MWRTMPMAQVCSRKWCSFIVGADVMIHDVMDNDVRDFGVWDVSSGLGGYEGLSGGGDFGMFPIFGASWGEHLSGAVALGSVPIEEIGALSISPLSWRASSSPGLGGVDHHVMMVLEVRPLDDERLEGLEEQFGDVTGRLVWNDTVLDVSCHAEVVEVGDDYIWIGRGFGTEEECDEWDDNDAMRRPFEEQGPPTEACISFTYDTAEYSFCEPLTYTDTSS